MLSWRPRRPSTADSTSTAFTDEVQRKLEVLALVARKLQPGQNRAERRTKKSGFGVEFADHRPYSPGDDYRFLDWKAFGRSNKLLLKQFEEEEDLTVHLLLDCSASMGLGEPSKLAYARLLAASLGYVALTGLDRVSVQAFGETLGARMPPTRGRARALRLLRFLDSLEATGRTDTASCMRKFAARERRRGIALLITDAFDLEGFRDGVDSLRYAKLDVAVLQVVDPRDMAPELRGDLHLVDVEGSGERDVTVTPKLLARYRDAYAEHQRTIAQLCRDKQVPHFPLSVDVPFEDAVLRVLRRGGVVR